jgi:CRP/FNR family cyclic AMP-dependent transcriptional regulator
MLAMISKCLATIPMFATLTESELNYLAGHMHVHKAEAGSVVFNEGDEGDYVCFVVDGVLDVFKSSESIEDEPMATLTEGCSIGEMAVIDDFPRSATVKARFNATLVTLSRDRLDFILESFPQVGIKILKELARLLSLHLRRTSNYLSDMLHRPAG